MILTTVCAGVTISLASDVKHEPKTLAIDCLGGDCPLLTGEPQTSGMRGGAARLKPGESIGWHSTSANEECLVILHGSGVAHIEGSPDIPLHEKMLVYIPAATRHNVTNTGTEPLEYVWLVAPVRVESAKTHGATPESQPFWTPAEESEYQACLPHSLEVWKSRDAAEFYCLDDEEHKHWLRNHPEAKTEDKAKMQTCLHANAAKVNGTREEFRKAFDGCMSEAYGLR